MIKKLLVGASALALAAGAANAQTSGADETVDGRTNAPGAAQAAATIGTQNPVSDDSDIVQTGDGNVATVDQLGDGKNYSDIDQKSPGGTAADGGNTADVDQTAAAGGQNNAKIEQESTDVAAPFAPAGDRSSLEAVPTGRQTARIDQTAVAGDANNALVLQGRPGAPGTENLAIVVQDGAGNDAAIQQGSNQANNDFDGNMYSRIGQTGTGQIAENLQGESDYSTIEQDGGSDNEAYVRQEAGFGDRNRVSIVDQTGSSNLAEVAQEGANQFFSDSFVKQDGNNNAAAVTQNSGAPTAITDSEVTQDGSRNRATVKQLAGSSGASSVVKQNEIHNRAEVTQSARARSNVEQGLRTDSTSEDNRAIVTQAAGSTDSFSDINQDGFSNRTIISQSGAGADSFAYTRGDENVVNVDQQAAGNVSLVIQYDAGMDAPGGGGSVDNRAVVQQLAGSVDSYSYIAQSGSGNVAHAEMNGLGETTAAPRYPDSAGYQQNEPAESQIWQVGVDNRGVLIQDANQADSLIYQGFTTDGTFEGLNYADKSIGNMAHVEQTATATNASSEVFQGGEENFAFVFQTAMDVESDVRQSGDDNDAYVYQENDGQVSFVSQTGGQTSANVARVYQLTSANAVSSIVQNGNGNSATVTQ